MFKQSEELSYDDNIEKIYNEYLILVEGYPTEAQIMAFEVEEWELKEKLSDFLGGYPDEYEIR